jgi:hypothetical protein
MRYIICLFFVLASAGMAGETKINSRLLRKTKANKQALTAVQQAETLHGPSKLAADIRALKSNQCSPALKAILLRMAGISSANTGAGKAAVTKPKNEKKRRQKKWSPVAP